MHRRLVPYNLINDFTGVAQDFSRDLEHFNNSDIKDEFPNIFQNHTGGLSEVVSNLESDRSMFHEGRHEQFIVYSGLKAVGMCVITSDIDSPDGVGPLVPNMSGFITNPNRGNGLGRFSIEERVKIVNERFGRRAWTSVSESNVVSEHLVASVGFIRSGSVADGRNLYILGDVGGRHQ